MEKVPASPSPSLTQQAAIDLPIVHQEVPQLPPLFYAPAVTFALFFVTAYVYSDLSVLKIYVLACIIALGTESAREYFSALRGGENDETIVTTLLYTLPLVVAVKAVQIMSSPVFFFLRTRGVTLSMAPDTVPIKRRKEMVAVLCFMGLLPGTIVDIFLCASLMYSVYTAVPLLTYIAWILFVDKSPRDGSRAPLMRSSRLWHHFCDYFPITMKSSGPLDPTQRYVFAYHPHGIIGLGAFGAFATDWAGFPQLFPGIERRLLTLDQNFRWPFLREVLIFSGVCSVARESCDAILARGPGSAVCIVVGGAAEALETSKDMYRLVLNRKGFVRVAVENNAQLVPVLGFGETSAFETLTSDSDSALRRWQVWAQQKLGFSLPVFWGRGILNYDFGFMPRRTPIEVVCGAPVNPAVFKAQGLEGEALVAAVHAEYVQQLTELFHSHKDSTVAGRARKESIRLMS
jgi:2-acylglycerol O-acyltransferase 2